MKKGFTLIELLAVVVIISLIIVFVVPSIMNSVKNSDDLEYKNFLETLSMAGETYYQSNKDICDFSNSNVCYLEVGNLLSSGLIEQDLINPKTEKQVLSNDTITILKDEYGTLTYSYSSNENYVKDNLILHYDAINNTGNGHSNNTTTWEDLSGNNNDGTIYSQKWGNNSLTFDGTNTYVSTPITSINESVTFEVVAKIPEVVSVDEQYLIAFSPEVYNYTGISFMNTGMMRPLSYYQSEMHNYIDYTKYIGKTITFTLVARKNGASAFYINGKKVLDYTSGDVSPGTVNLTIGDLRANRGLKFKGDVYSVRVYDGTLTEQEVKQNYEIDANRYGIAQNTTDDYVQNNLVLHYDAINNTGSGHSSDTTTWKDLSGNNNDGTLQGFSFDINNGWTSNSLKINGKNFVTASNAELTNFTSSDFTIEVVFKNIGNYSSYNPLIVSNGWYQTYGYYVQFRGDGRVSINTNQSGTSQDLYTSQNKIISNKNIAVTFVRKGTNMKVYVNGILDGQVNNIVDPATSTTPYTINANKNWNGELMNTRVYNRALTEQEITDNFNLDKIRYNIKEA